ncbi:hypothetical protein [Amycolatopsis sp. lyj-90]|uniref:hypothetical protein n=1 Tax=Amycolatopsis sp. lyj-90 TaxID=2789285 RepID=UPI00397818A2
MGKKFSGMWRHAAGDLVAAASALGETGGIPWEVELDQDGRLTVTGATADWINELAATVDPVGWLAEQDGLIGLTEGGGLLPARGPEIPDGPVPPVLPARMKPAPGRELRVSGHERASEHWALRVLPDGTFANGSGRFGPLDPKTVFEDADDPAVAWRECFHPEDPDMWTEAVEIVRAVVPALRHPLVASYGWLGALEISTGGEVAVAGRQSRALLELLVDTGLAADPFGTVRRSARLLADRIPDVREHTPGVVVTLGARITPYTSGL